MASDQIPLVVSWKLLQTFAQDLGRLDPDIQKEIAHYAFAQIQPRVGAFEEQMWILLGYLLNLIVGSVLCENLI